MKKVLFVGESWSATLMEVKGFNSFLSSKCKNSKFIGNLARNLVVFYYRNASNRKNSRK